MTMPSRLVNDLIHKMEKMEVALETHLREGGEVRSDIRWLKWFVLAIATGLLSLWFKK